MRFTPEECFKPCHREPVGEIWYLNRSQLQGSCRARSMAEFIAKLGIVVEEADETVYWLDLLAESGLVKRGRLKDLQQEAGELLAIFSASQLTAKGKRRSIVNNEEIGNHQ